MSSGTVIPKALAFTLALALAGCGGSQPSASSSSPSTPDKPATQQTAPTPDASAKKHALAGKTTTVDLTPYGIRAVIDLPAGAEFKSENVGLVHIGYGKDIPGNRKQFDLVIERNDYPFAVKKAHAKEVTSKVIAEADDRFFFDNSKSPSHTLVAMGRKFLLDDDRQYLISFRYGGAQSRVSDLEPIWAAIQSLRSAEEPKAIPK